jgi:hypothetical protein
VEGKGQDVFEIDLFGGFPAWNLEVESGSRDQQSTHTAGLIPVQELLGHLTQTIWS